VDPRINFLLDAYHSPAGGGLLAYPELSSDSNGYFGPNFAVKAATVPCRGLFCCSFWASPPSA
jgi:hypothetical protein